MALHVSQQVGRDCATWHCMCHSRWGGAARHGTACVTAGGEGPRDMALHVSQKVEQG